MKTFFASVLGTMLLSASPQAGIPSLLHSFGTPLGNVGVSPGTSVVIGPDGSIYGTAGGGNYYGVLYDLSSDFQLKTFSNTGDGAYPNGELILNSNVLYGTTAGTFTAGSYGNVFRINTDGTGFTVIYSFTNGADGANPVTGLVVNSNVLYGTASIGGQFGSGTVFKVNADGTGFKVLKAFPARDQVTLTNTDGAYPQGTLLLSGTTLFGTTEAGGPSNAGTVFALPTDGNGFTMLHPFDITNGMNPYAGLAITAGVLYGTTYYGGTNGCGIIFRLNSDGSDFTNLYSLSPYNSDGINPRSRLLVIGATLYGTTSSGAANGYGTVFSVNTDGSDYTPMHVFTALDPDNYNNNDGASPDAGLFLYNGMLYGTTSYAGYFDYGSVFQINPSNLSFNPVYYFDNQTAVNDGQNLESALTLQGGTLYGVTAVGGTVYVGTVFKINMDGSGFTNLHFFSGPDGANPVGSPLVIGNVLYGTTSYGGSNSAGEIYSVNTDGTGFTNLYSFISAHDGSTPLAGLILGGSMLYGTTSAGGSNGVGTVFAIGTNGMNFSVLHPFASSEGTAPHAPLLLANGVLYGETYKGGNGVGSLFKVQTDGGNFGTLRVFSLISGEGAAGEGAQPTGGLVLIGGTLYGTSYSGGENHTGNVFKIGTNGLGYATLFNFETTHPISTYSYVQTNSTGSGPECALCLHGSILYGTTYTGGITGYGTLFEVNTNANGISGFTNLYTFSGGVNDGGYPEGGVLFSGSQLFGTADTYGAYYSGVVFNYGLLPRLQTDSIGNSPIIYWADDGQTYTLQTTTNLASGNWSNAPALNWTNGQTIGLQITNHPPLPAAFFRLKQ